MHTSMDDIHRRLKPGPARDSQNISLLDLSLESADQTISFSPATARKTLEPWAEALASLQRHVDVKGLPVERVPRQQAMEERIEIALGKEFPKSLFRWVSAEDLCANDSSQSMARSAIIADILAKSSTSRLSVLLCACSLKPLYRSRPALPHH